MALVATALTLSACKREATGQVVAVVNGQEISLSELNAELRASGIQPNPNATDAEQKAIRAAALQRLIDRKLLVQQAKDRGLDKDPEYLQQQIRANDGLLVQMLGKQVTSNLAIPSQSEIDKFIADNPSMFGARTIYSLDQVVFAAPADRSKLKPLEADHTLDAVKSTLTNAGVSFNQGKNALDSARVPPQVLRQILALPPGEPFVLGDNGQVVISVITGKQAVPLDAKASRALATEALRRQETGDAAQKQVKQARSSAKIEYQPGFAPPKGTPTGAPAAS